VWIAEGYFFPSAFPLLAAAAGVTRRLPLVAGVVNPYTRHPAGVALEFPHAGASVPIVLGAKEPRGLALAGAVGDGLHLSVMTTPAYVRRARATAEAARREAGRDGGRLPVTANVLVSIAMWS
jgi:alkanesulfonate monooxygenase SsuD/methylene tetrahydromethanopterin reductase-like flavin-dependent oxidoreductase (luciferase family)